MSSRKAVVCAVMLAFPLLAACRTEPNDAAQSQAGRTAILTSPPSITGVLTAVQPDRRLRIEENPDQSSGSAKAVVRLTDDAAILTRGGRSATFGELHTGMRVSAWFSGPVMESYPVQATANMVVIETGKP